MTQPALSVAAAVAAAGIAAAATADVVEIGAEKDNTLYEDILGLLSNGEGAHFFTGFTARAQIRRGLVAFDVAGAIPAGSTITSVTLTLHMSRAVGGEFPVGLHRVLKDWGEGESDAPGQAMLEGSSSKPTACSVGA